MKHFLLLFLSLTLFACEGLPDNPQGLRALADKMDAQKDIYDPVQDTWQSGDVTSTFTAYLESDVVAFIEEHMTRGTSGTAINHYYFYNNQLFCYRETRTNTDKTQIKIEILFDVNGDVMIATQTQNGQPVATSNYIVPMAKKHSQTLYKRIQETALTDEH